MIGTTGSIGESDTDDDCDDEETGSKQIRAPRPEDDTGSMPM